MGPITLFDKSFLQALSFDEAALFDMFFAANISPIFFVETLADLQKNFTDRNAEEEVGRLAARTPTMHSYPNVYHAELCLHDLLSGSVKWPRVPAVRNGVPVREEGKVSVVYRNPPEAEAFERWRKKKFQQLEREFAMVWREHLQISDLRQASSRLLAKLQSSEKPKTLEEAKEMATKLVVGDGRRYSTLKIAYNELLPDAEPQFWPKVLKRWKSLGGPPLIDFAPYAMYVFTIEVFFHLCIQAGLISADRPSNKVDLAYLYYLPFCMVFVSSDKLHERIAPLFLRENQVFVSGKELKADLKRLRDHYATMDAIIAKEGLIRVTSKFPPDQTFLTRQIADKVLKVVDPAHVDLPANFDQHPKVKDLLDRVKRLSGLAGQPQGPFTKDELDDPDSVTIQRMVPLNLGRWRMLPEGVENKQDEPLPSSQPKRPTEKPRPKSEWPNAARQVHLAGGLHAFNNARQPQVQFSPRLDLTPSSFEIADYHDLLGDLRRVFDLKVIGFDLIHHQLQADGHVPPDWIPFHEDLGGNIVTKTRTLWSDLGTGGLEADNRSFIDLCHRIKFQIDSSAWRLRDISIAYATELTALVETGGYQDGKRIDTMNSFAIEIAVHSFLTDMATLRDYLAEFIAKFILAEFCSGEHIRLMAKLKSKVLPLAKGKHELADYLDAVTADNGWLKVLSDYRDLAVHYSPLSFAENKAWVFMQYLVRSNGAQFPSIRMPLPHDPAATKQARSKFDSNTSWKQWQRENFGDRNQQQGPDTLQYCHEMLGRMTLFASGVGGHSPIRPKRQTFDSSNSWGMRKVNREREPSA